MRQNAVEWAVLAASAAVIVTLIAVMLGDGVSDEGRPPQPTVEVRVDDATTSAAGWLIPATVGNSGDMAAEQVMLEAVAKVGENTETSAVEIDFLPAGANVDVVFGFSDEPSGVVAVRVVGFRLP